MSGAERLEIGAFYSQPVQLVLNATGIDAQRFTVPFIATPKDI